MFIYARLTNALIEAQTALSEGEFAAARVALTDACDECQDQSNAGAIG